MPPSLDLGGITVKKFHDNQAFGAQQRAEERTWLLARNPELAQSIADREEELKNKELSQDPPDPQSEEAVDEAMAVAAGSKTREDHRISHEMSRKVSEENATGMVLPLRPGAAFGVAQKMADGLWRDYALGNDRVQAVDRILSYLRSMERPAYDGGDPNALLGGPQYIMVLAALLTPKHMAWIKQNDPDGLKLMLELRSHVAASLIALIDKKKVSGTTAGKLVHSLSGYTDTKDKTLFVASDARKAWLEKAAARDRAINERTRAEREANKAALPKTEPTTGRADGVLDPSELLPKRVKMSRAERRAQRKNARAVDETSAFFDATRVGQGVDGVVKEKVGTLGGDKGAALRAEVKAERAAADETQGAGAPVAGRTRSQPMTQEQVDADTASANATTTNLMAARSSKALAKAEAPYTPEKVQPRAPQGVAQPRVLVERKSPVDAPKTVSTGLETLPNPPVAPSPYSAKEAAKLVGADLVLAPTSTEGYAGSLGRWALAAERLYNAVKYPDMTGKTLLVSVPGAGRGFTSMPALISRVLKALDNGATVRTDNRANAERTHNRAGEGALRAALLAGGYVEKAGALFSSWVKGEVAQPAQPKVVQPESPATRLMDAFNALEGDTLDLWTAAEKGDKAAQKLVAAHNKAWEDLSGEIRDLISEVKDKDRAADLRERLNSILNDDPEGLVELYGELNTREVDTQTKDMFAGSKHNDQAAATKTPTEAEQKALMKIAAEMPPKFHEIIKAREWLRKVLGPQVKVMLEESFPGMTWNGDYANGVIRIATANPVGIMEIAYHESVHAFFDNILSQHPETRAMLEGVFATRQMKDRLKAMLTPDEELDAEQQAKVDALMETIENNPEERVAYAFQFWAMGMLDVDVKAETFFQKVQALLRRVFGAVRDSEKALAVFEAFHDGKLAETSEAGKAIQRIMSKGEWRKEMLKKYDKLAQALYSEVMTNEQVINSSESATARGALSKFYTNPGRAENAEGEPGMINRQQMEFKKAINRMMEGLKALEGPNSDRDLLALGKALNEHSEPAMAHIAKAKRFVQAQLKQQHEYMKGAGLDIGERYGTGGDMEYYPRVMDIEYLTDHKDEFVAMLMSKYPTEIGLGKADLAQKGQTITEADVAERIYDSFINREGVDDAAMAVTREDGVLDPLFWSGEVRNLHWIKDEDIAPFLSSNVVATLTQYIRQGTRAAEYVKTWGQGGEQLRDMMAREGDTISKKEKYAADGPVLRELKEAAAAQKLTGAKATEWVERRYEDLQRAFGAMEGVLGKDISPTWRKFQAVAMTLQTLRLLPFMLFSSMLDPNSIRVAGGTHQDMIDAYKRGFGAVWDNWKDMLLGHPANFRGTDADEMAALEAGVVDNLVRLENMGIVASSEYSSGKTREINHAFFKAIGVTHWDRAMRISAMSAARRSIASMVRGDSKEHSVRWLKEIGLKPEQVTLNAAGEMITTRSELMAFSGLSREEAAAALTPVHHALNRWVARAIVSPNAAIRPTRASDPHFAMFYQFKSFTYAFQETTMRYAASEAAAGNTAPLLQLATGVPIMIAADMTKAMVLGGGSLPGYMASWTLADWIKHGINRSGTLGILQLGTDALSDPMSLLGPSTELAGSLATAPFRGEIVSELVNTVPLARYAR